MAKAIYDALLELRDIADGAETGATVDETGVAFAGLVPTHPFNTVGHDHHFKVVVDVTALTLDSGATNFVVDVDSLAAFSDAPVEVARIPIAAVGRYEIALNMEMIKKLDANAAAIRCGVTQAGGSPSITYGAFITKV